MKTDKEAICIGIIIILVLLVVNKVYYEKFLTYSLTMEPAPLHVSRMPWSSGAFLRSAAVDSASNRGVRDSGYIDATRYINLGD